MNKKLIRLTTSLLCLIYSTIGYSGTRISPVGYIQGGQYTDAIVKRDGVDLKPKLFFGIQTGDTIESHNNKPITIEVRLCSKEVIIELKSHEHHTFDADCSDQHDRLSNWFLNFIAAPLDNLYTSAYGEGVPKVAATRNTESGNEIKISLMQSDASLIVPGERNLEIKWAGGSPPFEISLKKKAGKVISKSNQIEGRRFTLPTIVFKERDKYRILIQDKNGNEVDRIISVMSLPEKPEWHNELNNLSNDDKNLVTAIWLHDYSADRRWSLEAYNILNGRKDTPALLVLDAILNDEDLNIPW